MTAKTLGLFEQPHLALARNSDPWTSHAAAEQIEDTGLLRGQKRYVYEALRRRNGSTSAELGRDLGIDRHVPGRRLPDLEREGLVRQGPVRQCRVKKRASVTWFVVEPPPVADSQQKGVSHAKA
jgi:DNA-binding MarR family transcriptional regulator